MRIRAHQTKFDAANPLLLLCDVLYILFRLIIVVGMLSTGDRLKRSQRRKGYSDIRGNVNH